MFNPYQPRGSNGKWSSGIIDSIEHQLRSRGKSPGEARKLATEIGQNHGFLDAAGNLTAKGREREAMGHNARVIDRTAKQTGHKPEEIGIQNRRPYVK